MQRVFGRIITANIMGVFKVDLVDGFDVIGCQIPFASVDMQHLHRLVLTNKGTAGMHPPQQTFL